MLALAFALAQEVQVNWENESLTHVTAIVSEITGRVIVLAPEAAAVGAGALLTAQGRERLYTREEVYELYLTLLRSLPQPFVAIRSDEMVLVRLQTDHVQPPVFDRVEDLPREYCALALDRPVTSGETAMVVGGFGVQLRGALLVGWGPDVRRAAAWIREADHSQPDGSRLHYYVRLVVVDLGRFGSPEVPESTHELLDYLFETHAGRLVSEGSISVTPDPGRDSIIQIPVQPSENSVEARVPPGLIGDGLRLSQVRAGPLTTALTLPPGRWIVVGSLLASEKEVRRVWLLRVQLED